MSYVSFVFFAFVALCVLLYYILPMRLRPYLLLAASVAFYLCAGLSGVIYLLVLAVLTYSAARLLERLRKRRKLLLTGYLLVTVGAWVFLKYANYALGILAALRHREGLTLAVLAPLGVSFFTLQAIGYVIDVYRHKYAAERNFFRVALFLAYFPTVVQGPICRMDEVGERLFTGHRFDYTRVTFGLQLALWGLFKKLVIANRAGVIVDRVFGAYGDYSGITVIAAVLLYTVQIYADFSGCVDLCRGISELFGVELPENFDHPYFSASVKEFWRRWHISLSAWLRDYVYIPLGGNRRGAARKYLNLLLTFLVSGLWHGVGLHYLVWGLYHGVCQIVGALTRKPKDRLLSRLRVKTHVFSFRLGQRLITLGLIAYSWLIFRADGLRAAVHMTGSIFRNFFCVGELISALGDWKDVALLLAAVIVLLLVSLLQRRGSVRQMLAEQNLWFRWSVYLLLLFGVIIFGVYGKGFNASDFLYMQY